jgi:streptogramin lyase
MGMPGIPISAINISASWIQRRANHRSSISDSETTRAEGFLEIEADADGNVWGAGMYQGLIAKVDAKTKKTVVYEIPKEWQSNSTQQSMVSPQFSNIDGKVWTNNQDDHSVLRLDVKTGKFENLGVAKDASGKMINGYGMPPDQNNNLYLLQFQGSEIGRVDAVTKE